MTKTAVPIQNVEIWNQYLQYEQEIKDIFLKHDIIFYPTGVRSQFGDEIKICMQSVFYDKKIISLESEKIETMLSKYAKIEFKVPKLGFGFLGRTKAGNALYITDGLQIAKPNIILFDLSTYIIASEEAFIMRVIHELLHTIGYNETEVIGLQDNIYQILDSEVKTFLLNIYNDFQKVSDMFKNKISKLEEENPELLSIITSLVMNLNDINLKNVDTPIYTDTFLLVYKSFEKQNVIWL